MFKQNTNWLSAASRLFKHTLNKINNVKTEYTLLKKTSLNNNCPECYSKEGLTLSFKQKKTHSKFMTKTKGDIVKHMNCTKCETTIFPGRWTEDIERIYTYHKKTIYPEPVSIRFTKLFYVIFSLILFLITGGISLYASGILM